jgi:hypothetical protein
MDFLKSLLAPEETGSDELFEKLFLTDEEVHQLAKLYFPSLNELCNVRQLGIWMATENYWKQRIKRQLGGERKSGRIYCVVKNAYRGKITAVRFC